MNLNDCTCIEDKLNILEAIGHIVTPEDVRMTVHLDSEIHADGLYLTKNNGFVSIHWGLDGWTRCAGSVSSAGYGVAEKLTPEQLELDELIRILSDFVSLYLKPFCVLK